MYTVRENNCGFAWQIWTMDQLKYELTPRMAHWEGWSWCGSPWRGGIFRGRRMVMGGVRITWNFPKAHLLTYHPPRFWHIPLRKLWIQSSFGSQREDAAVSVPPGFPTHFPQVLAANSHSPWVWVWITGYPLGLLWIHSYWEGKTVSSFLSIGLCLYKHQKMGTHYPGHSLIKFKGEISIRPGPRRQWRETSLVSYEEGNGVSPRNHVREPDSRTGPYA